MALALVGGVALALLPGPAAQTPGPAASAPSAPPPAPLTESSLRALWQGYDPPKAAAPQPAAAPPAAIPPSRPDEAPPQTIPFKVRGIIFSHDDPSMSVAFLEMDKTLSFFRVGGSLAGWRIASIEAGAVTVESKGLSRRLPIEQAAAAPAPQPAAAATAAAAAAQPTPPGASPETPKPRLARRHPPAAMINPAPVSASQPLPADAILVPASLVDQVKANPFEVLQREKIAVAPLMEGGQMAGVRLDTVPSDSTAAKYGFRSGDRIVAVNGQALDSPTRILQLYNSNRDAKAVSVTVERNGQRREMTFATQ